MASWRVDRQWLPLIAALLFTSQFGVASSATATPMFMGLGDIPGGIFASRPFAISGDGLVVVGGGRSASGEEAFRWTAGGGMVGIGKGNAFGVSADGSVVVGEHRFDGEGPGSGSYHAFRWTVENGMVDLTPFASGAQSLGVSADGSTVVGTGCCPTGSNQSAAFRWSASDGLDLLNPPLFLNATNSSSTAVSADGSTVVGRAGNFAFTWNAVDGMTSLGIGRAHGISADGSIILGKDGDNEAFRWTVADGMVGLGFLSGDSSTARGVSDDGSVIVGDSSGIGVQQAFIWDPENGMQALDQVLTDLGIDLAGWNLEFASAISADGNTIVGFGRNPLGQEEAWIATIPEPSTALLLGVGLVALGARQRHRS